MIRGDSYDSHSFYSNQHQLKDEPAGKVIIQRPYSHFMILEKIIVRPQFRRLVKKRGQILKITKDGKRISTSQIANILIINQKSPKVKIAKGRVISFISGLKK